MIQYLNDANDMILKSSSMPSDARREFLNEIFTNIYNEAKKGISINDAIKISQLENMLSERMILVDPIISSSQESLGTKKQMLEQIVYYSRKRFQDIYNCDIKIDSLRNRSKDMNNILEDVLNTLNVTHVILDLGKMIDMDSYFIAIIIANEELYLIDLTYQQFFTLGYNFENRYYEYPTGIKVCEIGGRMLKNITTAINLIENGYLLCKTESFKIYMDAFMEYRGLIKKDTATEYLEFILLELKEINNKISKKILSKI